MFKTPEKLDLSKRWDGYVNKRIFHIFIAVAALLVLIALWQNDFNFETQVWVSCPNLGEPCTNILYDCRQDNLFSTCDRSSRELCAEQPLLCASEFLEPGETLGSRPTPFQEHLLNIILFWMLGGFVVNHIFYMRKIKKQEEEAEK